MDFTQFTFFLLFFIYPLNQRAKAGGRTSALCQDEISACPEWAEHCSVYLHVKQKCPLTCKQCVNNSPFALVTPFTSSRHLVSTRCTLFTTRTSTVEIINRGTSLKNTIITPAASTKPAVSTSPAASTTYFTQVNALLTLGIIWSHILCH